ncbi:MAG: hypothetical protein R3E53_02695 [Myxococcota bacterium]
MSPNRFATQTGAAWPHGEVHLGDAPTCTKFEIVLLAVEIVKRRSPAVT